MSEKLGRYPLGELAERVGRPIRTFVCSSSYEERCLSISMALGEAGVGRAIVLKNVDIEEVNENAERLVQHFGVRGALVEVDTGNPISSVQNMYSALGPVVAKEGPDGIVVDITTFTHEQLLILLALLRRLGVRDLTCLYSGAAAYMTGEKEWLSKGILGIRSVLGFSGDLNARVGVRLIVLVGFEWERAQRLIEAYDPVELSLGIGRQVDAIEDQHFLKNQKFFEELLIRYPHAKSFEFSCNDPQVTAQVLEEQCSNSALTPVVAPMNTKISTVGAALAAFRFPEIQLCYAQAAVYNSASYSRPGKYFRMFDIEMPAEE